MPRMDSRPKPLESETTPGVNSVRSDQRRPLIGRLSISLRVRLVEKSGPVVLMSGAAPETWTVCVPAEATARVGCSVVLWPTSTSTVSI
jgi:hypothetical protein